MALSFSDAVQWYYSFARFNPISPRVPDDEKLAQMRAILARLGNPHTHYPSILIAGTKGKGSTAALTESVLRTAGYRTGIYTSPHLHSFRERIRVGRELISQAEVIQGTTELQAIADDFPYSTFFEWVTALALTFFASQHLDLAVIEVGLGGRLDCTNVVTPQVSVITPISYDHMEILGSTLDAIAREKAGICKPGVPVIVAPQLDEPMNAIREVAAKTGAPLIKVAQAWTWDLVTATPQGQTVKYCRDGMGECQTYQLPLLGPHQRLNLATTLTIIDTLREQGWKIAADAVHAGIQNVEWFARFEILSDQPVIVADGAHNRASAHELVRTLNEVFPDAPIHFIFGASTDKDIPGMLQELSARAASFTFTQAHHARAATLEQLAAIPLAPQVETRTAPSVAAALTTTRRAVSGSDVICVTGSLFIAAEARAAILPNLLPEP